MSTENFGSPTGVRTTLPSPRDGSVSAPNNSLLGPASLNLSLSTLKHSPVSRTSSFVDRRLHSPPPGTPGEASSAISLGTPRCSKTTSRKTLSEASVMLAKARARSAQRINDSMVYLDGPQLYTCAQCRTHLTSHDDIISKSFHGRHGRAYLFDQCVNVTIGPAEDRMLITGLHSVCDIFCRRCKGMVGWTYAKAYESSQKYKEGKYIIEKINLHMEESDYYAVSHPAGERPDRWRLRSMSWGSESMSASHGSDIVYEYQPNSNSSSSVGRPYMYSPRNVDASSSCPTIRPRFSGMDSPSSSNLPIAPDL
mmetsp:Transcript_13765/g.22783  ORF Transcript_13765/g.22783 Transcript_13765/m.22783 type:complete len:310 (-) Transcript_13765:160-1089(-)|eukprot:CAMPEP_0119008068 /NCGR_PEP_ID=MMETSP1176-20130426/3437_1 /TAXON_ID=265551 /ORGANISM="Synedropsis recta cf, Strain CCMP1620" /LENGTH=309 /DNA_ID=CAMNT_0006960329 /DNA_START=440 /DNA_END=1369 /DNA_ORIENTATION=+